MTDRIEPGRLAVALREDGTPIDCLPPLRVNGPASLVDVAKFLNAYPVAASSLDTMLRKAGASSFWNCEVDEGGAWIVWSEPFLRRLPPPPTVSDTTKRETEVPA